MSIEEERREFVYPSGCRPRPGIIERYQEIYPDAVVLACYSYPTSDPNVHDLKIVTRPKRPEDTLD